MNGFSFRAARPRRRGADVVPMINVAFLLLIFFLLSARIVPPEPLDVDLPSAAGTPETGAGTLYMDADGALAFAGHRGEAAFDAAVAVGGRLVLAVDSGADATALAALLRRLGAAGATDVSLAVAPPS